MQKEKIIMVCPQCQKEIQGIDHLGITQINSIIHLYCDAWPQPGERVIKEGLFRDIREKYLQAPVETGAFSIPFRSPTFLC